LGQILLKNGGVLRSQVSGIGSVKGALIGALLVGLTDTMGGVLLPALFRTFMDGSSAAAIGSALASMMIYVLMAGVLIFKPTGLFGNRT
jgi:branched-chain amino acid transport system permease protein